MSTLASLSRSLPRQNSLPQTATRGEWVQQDGDFALVRSWRRDRVKPRLFDRGLWKVGLRRTGPFDERQEAR